MGLCPSTRWQRKNFYYSINDIQKTIAESIKQYKSAVDNLNAENSTESSGENDLESSGKNSAASSGNEKFVKLVNLPSLKNDDGEKVAIAEVKKMWESAER